MVAVSLSYHKTTQAAAPNTICDAACLHHHNPHQLRKTLFLYSAQDLFHATGIRCCFPQSVAFLHAVPLSRRAHGSPVCQSVGFLHASSTIDCRRDLPACQSKIISSFPSPWAASRRGFSSSLPCYGPYPLRCSMRH